MSEEVTLQFIAKKGLFMSKSSEWPSVLTLEMKDKNGVEYCDGDVVAVEFPFGNGDQRKMVPMKGYIRYFGGRFEIVCPFADQRFIMGINPNHEIIGHIFTDEKIIADQFSKKFNAEGKY